MGEKILLDKFEQQTKELKMSFHNNEKSFFSIENKQVKNKQKNDDLKALFDAIPIPIFITRKSDSKILFANNYFLEMMGFKENVLIGSKTLNLFYDLSDRDTIRRALKEKGFIRSFEFPARTIDGKKIWVVTSSQPASFQGDEVYISGFYDITQRKQAELALRENKERMALALEGTDQGLWEWDIVTGAIYFSDDWCRIMGYSPGEIDFDYDWWERAIHPESRIIFKETLKNYLKSKKKYYDWEYKIKTKSGEWKWIWTRGTCLDYGKQGEPLRIIGIDRDCTNRKTAQLGLIEMNKSLDKKIKERTLELKRLNEYIANSEENGRKHIAADLHDSVTQTIGISISKIKTFKESVSESELDKISQIQDHLEQANREIRSIVYELRPPVVDDFTIDLALGFLIEETNNKNHTNIEYINNLSESVHLIKPNKIVVYRAVCELISNILKHSGSLEAHIELTKIKSRLCIRVEDKGSGFDSNSIHRGKYSGFGLYNLSERLTNAGGDIIVNSTIGKGTKVVISIPINQ